MGMFGPSKGPKMGSVCVCPFWAYAQAIGSSTGQRDSGTKASWGPGFLWLGSEGSAVQTKIREEDVVIFVQQNVVWLQVPVQNAVLVQVLEGGHQLGGPQPHHRLKYEETRGTGGWRVISGQGLGLGTRVPAVCTRAVLNATQNCRPPVRSDLRRAPARE